MMKSGLLIVLLAISPFISGQTETQERSSAFTFIDSIMVKDTYTVEFLDFVFPQDVQEILLRFQKAMAENKEWTEEFFSKNYKTGEGLPYHENFGITKEEYQKIKDLDKTQLSIVVKSTSTISCIKTLESVLFKVYDKSDGFFELIEFDFKNELLKFNNDTIPYQGEINAPGSTPFGEWYGHSWKKEISNLGENDALKMDKLVSKIIEINFGKTNQSDKIIFRFKYKDVNQGTLNANVDIVCYLF